MSGREIGCGTLGEDVKGENMTILCMFFMIVWIHIFMTSAAFHKKMEKMVEGQDSAECAKVIKESFDISN